MLERTKLLSLLHQGASAGNSLEAFKLIDELCQEGCGKTIDQIAEEEGQAEQGHHAIR
jgi:hypothetical protein